MQCTAHRERRGFLDGMRRKAFGASPALAGFICTAEGPRNDEVALEKKGERFSFQKEKKEKGQRGYSVIKSQEKKAEEKTRRKEGEANRRGLCEYVQPTHYRVKRGKDNQVNARGH